MHAPTPPGGHHPTTSVGTTQQLRGGDQHSSEPLFWFIGDIASPASSSSTTTSSSSSFSSSDSTSTATTATGTAKSWKLFVGQVPKNATEAGLRALFAPYGEVVQMNILRDKVTQVSRGWSQPLLSWGGRRLTSLSHSLVDASLWHTRAGCAFVTYANKEAADKGIAALHNVVCVPPVTLHWR